MTQAMTVGRSYADLAGAILGAAGLRAFRRMAGAAGAPGSCSDGFAPGRFHGLCRAEADGMLRDLEDADPAVAAAVSLLIEAGGW